MSTKWLTCLRATRLWCMRFLSSAASNSGSYFWMRVASDEEPFKSPGRTALIAVLYVSHLALEVLPFNSLHGVLGRDVHLRRMLPGTRCAPHRLQLTPRNWQ